MLNQISKVAGVGFATTLALALSANNVQAFDFTFSFESTNTPGTVEGTITGLNEGTGSADSVLINSFPAGLGGSFDLGNDPTLWSNQVANSFTVNSGSITAASFEAYHNGIDDGFCLNSTDIPCGSGTNLLTLDNGVTIAGSFGSGFAGATYAAATPVPFGVSTDLSLLILGGLYGASRLRKKFAASK